MSLYRVVTPNTPRRPGKTYADFESAYTVDGPFSRVEALIDFHGRRGCAVWKRKRGHWELILDHTMTEHVAC